MLSDRNRYRRDPPAGDLRDRRLDVLGIVVTPPDDHQVLDAADDVQLARVDEAEVAGAQPRPLRRAGRRVDERCAEARLLLRRLSPVAVATFSPCTQISPTRSGGHSRRSRCRRCAAAAKSALVGRPALCPCRPRTAAPGRRPARPTSKCFAAAIAPGAGWPRRPLPPPDRTRAASCGREIEVREPIHERLQGGRLDTFGTADDAYHPAEVKARQVDIGGLAGSQVEGEVRAPTTTRTDSRPALASIWPAAAGTPAGCQLGSESRRGSGRRLPAPDPCRGRRAATTRSSSPAAAWSACRRRSSLINCSKFTVRLRWESMTPVGSRVEPELYCR